MVSVTFNDDQGLSAQLILGFHTNRGRIFGYQPLDSPPDQRPQLPLPTAPGTTIPGFYANQVQTYLVTGLIPRLIPYSSFRQWVTSG